MYQTTFELAKTRHEFEVIRLWEQPSSRFLSTLGLLPFTVLTATEDRPELLRQVARQIAAFPSVACKVMWLPRRQFWLGYYWIRRTDQGAFFGAVRGAGRGVIGLF